jgi:hypothetical protein
MGIGRKTLLAWGASLAVLAFGAPAFASGAHPGSLTAGPLNSNGSNTSNCKFYVSMIQVTPTPSFPVSQFTLAITVNDVTETGTWYFPEPTPTQVSNNPQALPKVEIMKGSTVVDASVLPTSIAMPIPSVTMGGTATAYYTYVLPSALPSGNYTVLLVASTSGNVFHMYNSTTQTGTVSTAPVCDGTPVPRGQLPEVPYAAAIPLAGLALGGLVWYRRTRLSA